MPGTSSGYSRRVHHSSNLLNILSQPATININFEFSGSGDDNYIVYEATNGFSQGRYNFDGSYRFIASVLVNNQLDSSQLVNAYTEKFGLYPFFASCSAIL